MVVEQPALMAFDGDIDWVWGNVLLTNESVRCLIRNLTYALPSARELEGAPRATEMLNPEP
jgi:hypothetical protein